MESTREISKIIVDFFESLDNHASALSQFVEETRTVHVKDFKNKFIFFFKNSSVGRSSDQPLVKE